MAEQVQQELANGGADVAKTVSFGALKLRLAVGAPKAAEAIKFYKDAFGAEETSRNLHPKRKADQELPLILSAQLQLCGSTIVVSDLAEESAAAAKTVDSGLSLCLETEDVEAAIDKAVIAGATKVADVTEEDSCCGGAVGRVRDPYGFTWLICSPSQKATTDAEA